MKNVIKVKNLSKSYDEKEILSNLSFCINEGDIVAIFGPNGCGKTTLLNILSGINEKTSGQVKIKTFDEKKFSYIFQNYRETLFPWRNNYENIAFPLHLGKIEEEEVRRKVVEMEEIFSFKANLGLYPYQLSGGQQQILAFMRALITEPSFLFIDEPFSALDYGNNLLMRTHLQKYYKKYKPTILAITHDIEEAVHLANKIIVLSKKPAGIVEIIENNAPYPRGTDFLNSKQFALTKKKVLLAFQNGAYS